MAEITTRERKIIDDILFHLDGWRTNDHPPETRKIESFLDVDDEHFDNNIRKEVSSREVLRAYDMAKVHALNYIKRKEFPNNPAIYQAICYWSAGLLSEKASFRDEKMNNGFALIEEARRILSPHIKRGDDFFIVSGDEFFWEDYMRSERHLHPRRDRIPPNHEEDGDEEKERLIHGHFHECPKEHFHYRPPHKSHNPCPPLKRKHSLDRAKEWIMHNKSNKYNLDIRCEVDNDYGYIHFIGNVTHHGKPATSGKLIFYVYVDD